MDTTTKISCGGFFLDDTAFEFTKDKVLKLKPQGSQNPNPPVDMSEYLRADGATKVKGTIDMDGHNLINITTIGGVHPTNNKIGFENEVDMGQHKIINVPNPTANMDVANKQYVDTTEANIESKVDRLSDKVAQITPAENKQLHFIETIECKAGTFKVEKTQDPSGIPYNFEEVQVYAVFPANTSPDNLQPRVNVFCGAKNLCPAHTFGNIQGNKDTMSYGYSAIYQWRGMWEAKSALANGNGWFAPDSIMVNVPPMMATTYPNIDKIEIFCENTTDQTQHDMNGMVFHIYAVEK